MIADPDILYCTCEPPDENCGEECICSLSQKLEKLGNLLNDTP